MDYTRGELEEIQAGVYSPAAVTVAFDGTDGKGKVSTAATLSTALTGTNNDMVFTADTAGTAGNGITIEYNTTHRQAGHSSAECHTTGKTICVDLKTSAGVAATSTITGSNAANATDGKVVVVGTTTYRLKSTMAQAYDVKIGASADVTLGNLIKAINASGTAGTEYFAGTLAHPSVTAGTLVAHAFVITAKSIGAAGNAIATTTDETTYSWTSTVMAGGEDVNQILSTAAEVKTAIEANTEAAALVNIANAGGNDGSGIVTAMAASNLTGGSDGTVTLFTAEKDGLVAVIGRCTATLVGNNATLEVGITGNTAALVPQATATTVTNGKRICRSGVIAHAPNATPFLAVKTGDVIKVTVGTASITDGTIEFQLYYSGFNADTVIKGSTAQGTLQDAAAATGNGTALSLAGMAAGNLAITGTFVGTVTFEAQDASGAWNAIMLQGLGVTTLASSATTTGVWRMPVGGFSAFRARISAYTSGAITVKVFTENTAYTPAVQNVGMYEGLDTTNDAISSYEKGWTTVNLTASGQILAGAGSIGGFRVNSTSSGTIRIADNTTAGSGYTGAAMTPAVGVYPIKPEIVSTGGYITITGTIDVTFWVRQGALK